jgi:hypothetical protein
MPRRLDDETDIFSVGNETRKNKALHPGRFLSLTLAR